MKKYMFIPLICLMLMSSTCVRDRTWYITIVNQSDKDIDLAYNLFFKDKCGLTQETVIERNSVLKWAPFNTPIERGMGTKSILEFYFVNNFLLRPNAYDCDSIPIIHDILRHYQLTLEDLRRKNFTIVFP